jgi:hypothetical protein
MIRLNDEKKFKEVFVRKSIKYMILSAGLWLVLGLIAVPPNLLSENVNKDFEIKTGGKITAGGQEFASFSEYFNSKYFKSLGRRCGVRHRDIKRSDIYTPAGSKSDCSLSKTAIKSEYNPTNVIIIPIVFHVIYKTDGTGNISDQRIADQVEVLNEDYRAMAGTLGAKGNDSMIQFELQDITRTANNLWFRDTVVSEKAFKQALGWDQNKYLNVYTNDAGGYLGYSYLPQEEAGNYLDGVVMLYEAVGGRDLAGMDPYDQGRTLVHEIGHYLGLLHTFGDDSGPGCYTGYTAGDLIDDTNSENDEHYGCTQTYSCGTADPIHNYMNYTDDICMYEFTEEQINRVLCSIFNYRPNLYESGETDSIIVTSPNGGESWTAGTTHTVKWTSTGTVGNVKISYSTNNGTNWTTIISSTANDGAYSWKVPSKNSSQCLVRIQEASDGTPSDTSNAVFSITTSSTGTPKISLNRTEFNFAATTGGTATSAQTLLVDNSGTGSLEWTATPSASWLHCTPSSGSGSGIVSVSVSSTGLGTGSYTGTITVADPNASNTPRTVTVYFDVISAYQDDWPFGTLSTPADGSSVSSSVPVTGWVLDDVQVAKVEIYRYTASEDVYIGDAVFVEGARPDIEAAYPDYPNNYKAGWGYMLLTHFLPNGGNGYFTLFALAVDSAGHKEILGWTDIYCNNAGAVKPFGAIDLPSQGGSASGSSFRNSGWVLTPLPNSIPTSGNTINVYVDGVYLGHPTYNIYRSDIATLFPGYANSNGAHAYFDFNTTTYDNGLHTIYWTATDNAGNADGIGSRFFTVENSGINRTEGESGTGISSDTSHNATVELSRPVGVVKGFREDEAPRPVYPGEKGMTSVEIRELERVVLHFTPGTQPVTPLPIGSTMDIEKGIFFWTPGPGFVGPYELTFINTAEKRLMNVKIIINQK